MGTAETETTPKFTYTPIPRTTTIHPLRPYVPQNEDHFYTPFGNISSKEQQQQKNSTKFVDDETHNSLKDAFSFCVVKYLSTSLSTPFETVKTLMQVQYIPNEDVVKIVNENKSPDSDEEESDEDDFLNSSTSSNHQLDSNSPGFRKLRPSDTQGYIKTNIHDDSTRPDYMISPLESGLRDSMGILKKHPYEGYSSLWKGQFTTWLYEIGYLYLQPNLESKLNETFDLYDDTIPLIYLDHPTPNVITKVASHLMVGVLLSPLEIVRTRLIVQSSSSSHKKYSGTFDCLSQIIKEEGLSSLYWSHNLLPSIVYHTVVQLLQCTRDLLIERIFHISPTESPVLFGFAQFGLSTLQLIITLPLETIRKRLQCQIKTRKLGRPFKTIVQTRQVYYFGMLDAACSVVLEEGISQKYVSKLSDDDGTSHSSSNRRSTSSRRNKRRQRGWLDNYGIGNLYRGFYMHLTMNLATFLFQVVNGNEDEYDDL